MRTSKALAACFVLLLLWVPAVLGMCSGPQPRLVCAEYFASEVVVKATLLRTRAIREKSDPEGIVGYVYTLKASEVLRGQISDTFRVYEGNDSGRAGFDWKHGEAYLLFLWFSKPENAWTLDGCGNSNILQKSSATLRAIKALQADESGAGLIQGIVTAEDNFSEGLPGVRIEASSGDATYRSRTDSHGTFRLRIPAGKYSLRALQPGASFESDMFSYAKAKDLRVYSGGCVQIHLVRKQAMGKKNEKADLSQIQQRRCRTAR